MANRYVRIHNKPEGFGEPASLIGFSYSAYPYKESIEAFEDHFEQQGHQVRWISNIETEDKPLLVALGGVSAGYLEVAPPISDEQLGGLGRLCAEHIDPRSNYGFLVDDRQTPSPLKPFDTRGPHLARW